METAYPPSPLYGTLSPNSDVGRKIFDPITPGMKDGYEIYRGFAQDAGRWKGMASDLLRVTSPGVIFNSKSEDNRRAQLALPLECTLATEVSRVVREAPMNLVTPRRDVDFVSVLVSYPGAKRQQAHSDDDPSDEIFSPETPRDSLPLSVIIALDPGTRVVMYPGSAAVLSRRAPGAPAETQTGCNDIGDPVVETLDPGDVLVIGCCTVHAGSESDTQNTRLFVAINSKDPRLVREYDKVYLWRQGQKV